MLSAQEEQGGRHMRSGRPGSRLSVDWLVGSPRGRGRREAAEVEWAAPLACPRDPRSPERLLGRLGRSGQAVGSEGPERRWSHWAWRASRTLPGLQEAAQPWLEDQ